MIDIGKEANAFASWPTQERLHALKRIIPRARVEEVLARTGQDRSICSRLPGWFMVFWFVVSWACSVAIATARSSAGCNRFAAAEPHGDLPFARRRTSRHRPVRFLANQVIACRAAWSKRLVRLVRRREAWSVKD